MAGDTPQRPNRILQGFFLALGVAVAAFMLKNHLAPIAWIVPAENQLQQVSGILGEYAPRRPRGPHAGIIPPGFAYDLKMDDGKLIYFACYPLGPIGQHCFADAELYLHGVAGQEVKVGFFYPGGAGRVTPLAVLVTLTAGGRPLIGYAESKSRIERYVAFYNQVYLGAEARILVILLISALGTVALLIYGNLKYQKWKAERA